MIRESVSHLQYPAPCQVSLNVDHKGQSDLLETSLSAKETPASYLEHYREVIFSGAL
jgi:hypothetical protein